ncbi:MAG: zinc-ribbon domain-containing protein [Clostridiales bacterium]|nr:zinc-ribbon domain-containing protein [Clostridiales bacterium]
MVVMIDKRTKVIGLKELELTNDDLFVRKSITGISEDSKVIVDETHVAILLKDGIALETLRPGIYPIYSKNTLFSKSTKLDTTRLELFFISKTAKVRILWGTPALFDIHDPISGIAAKMGASGEIEIRIKNPRQFYIEVVGSNAKFTVEDLKERLKGVILSRIEPTISSYIEVDEVPLDRIGEEKLSIARYLQQDLKRELSLNYGLEVSNVIVSNVNIADKYKEEAATKLRGEMACPHCGVKLVPGSKFCNNCGMKVR